MGLSYDRISRRTQAVMNSQPTGEAAFTFTRDRCARRPRYAATQPRRLSLSNLSLYNKSIIITMSTRDFTNRRSLSHIWVPSHKGWRESITHEARNHSFFLLFSFLSHLSRNPLEGVDIHFTVFRILEAFHAGDTLHTLRWTGLDDCHRWTCRLCPENTMRRVSCGAWL